MKVVRVCIRECSEPQIPLIGVISIELKVCEYIRSLQLIRILETIAQTEGSVMMKIVAEKHVGGSCQFADSFQSRVRFEHGQDRKSTRLNSSHVRISYAVFC